MKRTITFSLWTVWHFLYLEFCRVLTWAGSNIWASNLCRHQQRVSRRRGLRSFCMLRVECVCMDLLGVFGDCSLWLLAIMTKMNIRMQKGSATKASDLIHTHTHLYRIMTPRLFTEALSFLLNLFKQRTPWWHHSLQLPEDSFVCPKYVASSKGHNSNPQQNRLRFNEPQKFDAMAEMAQRWMERSSTVFLHRRGKKATESSAEDVLSLLAPQATLQLQLMIW